MKYYIILNKYKLFEFYFRTKESMLKQKIFGDSDLLFILTFYI